MTSEGTSNDLSLAKWAPETPTVQEIIQSMQNFDISDYTVFAAMLVVCGIVGIYFGFVKKSSGEDEYLVGGRNMSTFPISLSLLASFISGINTFHIFFYVLFFSIANKLKQGMESYLLKVQQQVIVIRYQVKKVQ